MVVMRFFRQEKMALSTPLPPPPLDCLRVVPAPPPETVPVGGRTNADVTTKISRSDRLPNLLSSLASTKTCANDEAA